MKMENLSLVLHFLLCYLAAFSFTVARSKLGKGNRKKVWDSSWALEFT